MTAVGMRRVLLLIGGIFGGFLVGWQLLLSAHTIMVDKPVPEMRTKVKEAVIFPAQVDGTDLVAQYPALYEGAFPEDGSGEYVVDVAALVLQNTASTGIENARVVLQWEQGAYVFEVDMLPAGKSVLVMEREKQPFVKHHWTACFGEQTTGKGEWESGGVLTVDEVSMGIIRVSNQSENILNNVRIYYKSYLPEEGLYIGGVTYCMGISEIAAGATEKLRPFHYAAGYSQVVRVTYNSRE